MPDLAADQQSLAPPPMTTDIRFFDPGFSALNGNGSLKRALGELVRLAAEGAHSTSASLYVVDPSHTVLNPLVTVGLPESYVEACGEVRIGDQCCGRAVAHRKPWVVTDMLTDPLFATARDAAVVSPIRAAFSVPVIDYKGECLASLACHYAEPHTPTNDEIERNELWATMIAHALSEHSNSAELSSR